MLYKFKSAVAGDVIMVGPHGDELLRILGREPGPQGIVTVEQAPAAIAAIEAAIAAEEAAFVAAESAARAEGLEPPARPGVSLRQRSWPMLELLRQAHRGERPVVWGV